MSGGWVILDKDSGVFSKTAAARISKIFGIRKNGHVGTLDPMASGVLPIALGDATKMIPFVEEHCDKTKEYLFSVIFGYETDTLDITGNETARNNIVPSEASVRGVLDDFIGGIMQVPPMFSAIHINGRRAYEIARSGQDVEIPARPVSIYTLDLIGVDNGIWNFCMRCAPGTYVRSVARDIAHRCGTLGTVSMIRRTLANGFEIKNAVKLDFLENLVNNGGDVGQYLAPLDFGLGGIPVLNLDDKDVHLYKNGGFITTGGRNGTYRVYSDNKFVGIGMVCDGVLRPKRTI